MARTQNNINPFSMTYYTITSQHTHPYPYADFDSFSQWKLLHFQQSEAAVLGQGGGNCIVWLTSATSFLGNKFWILKLNTWCRSSYGLAPLSCLSLIEHTMYTKHLTRGDVSQPGPVPEETEIQISLLQAHTVSDLAKTWPECSLCCTDERCGD